MTVFGHHDFDLDGPPAGPTPTGEPPPAPEPLVIIEYRTRRFSGVLIPPALILALAAVLVAYRPELSRWITPPQPARPPRPPARPKPDAEPTPPIVLQVKTLPVDPGLAPDALDREAPADPDAAVAAVPPLDPPRPGGGEPEAADPEAAVPEVADPEEGAASGGLIAVATDEVTPDPEAAARIAREEIRRAVERVKAKQAEAAWMRAREAELDRVREIQARQARQQQAEEARELAQKARDDFRAELLDALRRFGDQAGPQILEIAERYHREPGAGIEQAITRALRRGRDRPLGRSQRVALLRAHGLPEPLILGDLIHLEQRRRGTEPARPWGAAGRGRGVDYTAVVRATRQLLALPPDAPPVPATHATLLPGRLGLLGGQ